MSPQLEELLNKMTDAIVRNSEDTNTLKVNIGQIVQFIKEIHNTLDHQTDQVIALQKKVKQLEDLGVDLILLKESNEQSNHSRSAEHDPKPGDSN